MAAEKGNTYAEKWTLDKALGFINEVKQYVQDNPDCVYIGEAITECGQYVDLWKYLSDKFQDNDKVFRSTRVIIDILEKRLYNKGLSKEFSARLVEFGLRNNHGWVDRKEIGHSGYISEDPPENLQELYDEEAESES